MHDLAPEAWWRKRRLQDVVTELIGSFGYRCLETPILEPTELFLRKSGGELASRLYSFTDNGSNSVSLRPEFTSPIMRHYLEHAAGIELPARWQYAGPVFRFEIAAPKASGQFTQVGAELLGADSIMADAEVLSLAALIPSHLGLADWRLVLGDLDVLGSILDTVGVSERARAFIVSSMPQLREGRQAVPRVLERAHGFRLGGRGGEDDYLGQAVQGLDDSQARVVLQGLLQWTAADQLGQRDPGEVVDRLLRKLKGTDDETRLLRGLELGAELAAVEGEPGAALDAAGAVVREAGANRAALDRLAQTLDLLLDGPGLGGHLALNFGLMRELAYYNGIVFEITHPEWSGSLGGGGRYDALARALGSPEPLPALGFAFNLEALLALTEAATVAVASLSARLETLVVAADSESCRQALEATLELHRQGLPAELDVAGRNLAQALAYATSKGMAQVVIVNRDGAHVAHPVE
ncbi:MAG: ATP phosphoribosyltransferase regulatory subunit [Chloroflexota bacterium]